MGFSTFPPEKGELLGHTQQPPQSCKHAVHAAVVFCEQVAETAAGNKNYWWVLSSAHPPSVLTHQLVISGSAFKRRVGFDSFTTSIIVQ